MRPFPPLRLRRLNRASPRPDADYVLYWMVAARRVAGNFALDRAVDWAVELRRPLVILEALSSTYRFASDRLHRFVLDGMVDNARSLARSGVTYFPYVEDAPGAGRGLLPALASRACVVVTDDFPAFGIPRLTDAGSRSVSVAVESVDSNGLLPMRAADRVFPTAHGFRRFVQRTLLDHLAELPSRSPLRGRSIPRLAGLPTGSDRWRPARVETLVRSGATTSLPIDHSVAPTGQAGGTRAARRTLRRFVEKRLARYGEDRNHPDADGTSGLSPYLHFGHLSAHEVLAAVAEREGWSPDRLALDSTGRREGWWSMSPSAEAFLDQLVTWRELGFNLCWQRRDYDRYAALPDWARATLEQHRRDPRPYLYTKGQLEAAETHDALWNAAQRQLLSEGRIHGYLRMLWGKKILEWSPSPRRALEVMIELNDRYALDGRDPNSYNGIGWVLGRYDRPWGPERPVFGTVRYMSSGNAARKLRLRQYLARFSKIKSR